MKASKERLQAALAWSWLLIPWGMLLVHLSGFWRLLPEYEFGWLVPPLAFYFFLRRWKALPHVQPKAAPGAGFIVLACAFLLLPMWVVRIAASDSYYVSYGLTLLVTWLTLAWLAQRGGWSAARQFAFPVFFILCAVPWSKHFETPLIEALTRVVTTVTVGLLQAFGIAATRAGNLVSLSNGTLGIEEACSGIRSFQSLIMAALGLGELRRLQFGARLALLAAAGGLALFFNLLRNLLLAIVAHTRGISAVNLWHDASGWSIFLISFYFLYQAAERFAAQPEPFSRGHPPFRAVPFWAGVGMAAWFASLLAAAECWYRMHEQGAAQTIAVKWPEEMPSYELQPVSQPSLDLLRCSSIKIANWKEENDVRWALSIVRWNRGEISTNVARGHHPEVCFPSMGVKWIRSFPLQRLRISGGELSFTSSEFESNTRSIYSFFAFYEESDRKQENLWFEQDFSFPADIRRALAGRRDLGKQTLEVVLTGFSTYEQALEAAGRRLPFLARFEQVKK